MTVTFIAISGASGSGKTLFAQSLVQELSCALPDKKISILHEDAYYKSLSHLSFQERTQQNFDHPDAFEHTLLAQHIEQLKNLQAVESPVYDFKKHTRSKQTTLVEPSRVVLVEGILLLSQPALRAACDTKIFIDTALDICFIRRLKRDIQKRGRTPDEVIEQYQNTVRPMYYEFVEPSKHYADIIVPRGGKNAIALEMVKNQVISLFSDAK